MFRSDGGRLIFQGKAGDDVLPALAAMHNITQKQGYRDVTLDFSGVTKFDAKFRDLYTCLTQVMNWMIPRGVI